MDSSYVTSAEHALQHLYKLKKSKSPLLKDLSQFENMYLKSSVGRNQNYYYVKNNNSDSYSYLGNQYNPTVQSIKNQRYLSRLLSDVDSEIDLLERLLSNHKDITYEAINSRLPATYRTSSPDIAMSESDTIQNWKALKETEKQQYPTRFPERLIMRALDGTHMRSKSEVIIANLLIANDIPFVYELPHEINGKIISTDFTVLSTIDYKTEILIEHEGLMNLEDYQQTFLFKVNNYLAEGIIPGRDLFFTFDDLRGGFDPSVIQDIIDTKLKP